MALLRQTLEGRRRLSLQRGVEWGRRGALSFWGFGFSGFGCFRDVTGWRHGQGDDQSKDYSNITPNQPFQCLVHALVELHNAVKNGRMCCDNMSR